MSKPKPKRRLKRKASFVISILLIVAVFAAGYCGFNKILNPQIDELGGGGIALPKVGGKRTNVLLLGIDARDGESMARTDSIIMASIDPKSKQIALLSIPRDTRVKIPGHGMDKINSASVYGGPELTAKVAADLLGIPLKHYVMTDFRGFEGIVDILGGVTIDVEQDMYHLDDPGYCINLSKGLQRLDGDKAVQYVRYRGYAAADIERTRQQQKFLMALAKEVLQPATIPKLPKLVPEINKCVKTNLNVSDMVKLASTLRSIDEYNMVAQTLPGRNLDIAAGSYWGVDPAEARQMVAKLFDGEVTTDIVLNTPLTGQYAPPPERKIVEEEIEPEDDDEKQGEAEAIRSPIKPARPDSSTSDGDDRKDGAGSRDKPKDHHSRPGSGAETPDDADLDGVPGLSDSGDYPVIILPVDDDQVENNIGGDRTNKDRSEAGLNL